MSTTKFDIMDTIRVNEGNEQLAQSGNDIQEVMINFKRLAVNDIYFDERADDRMMMKMMAMMKRRMRSERDHFRNNSRMVLFLHETTISTDDSSFHPRLDQKRDEA